jgi:hypothetical protein
MTGSMALLVFTAAALRAETVLLTHDASGNLLRQAPAALRKGGLALVPRDAFFGAKSARLIDPDGRMHPVLWISAEDADAGVLEVFVGAQAPAGPDAASSLGRNVLAEGHQASVENTKEAGGFGVISRLDCRGAKEAGGPLYDEHGLLAGWHATREIDGQVLAFAIPLSRFDAISQTMRLSIEDWNVKRDRGRESAYQRAMGHLWVEDFDGALFYFRKAVEAEPQNARAWYHLAFAEGKSGHGKAKTACYKKAVDLDPGFAPAHYYLGFSLLLNGDRDGALAEYKKLKVLDEGWALRLRLFLDAAHVDVLEKGSPAEHARRLV